MHSLRLTAALIVQPGSGAFATRQELPFLIRQIAGVAKLGSVVAPAIFRRPPSTIPSRISSPLLSHM
jgi:hypothetical protein